MWIETTPKENDLVKIVFSEISELGTMVGVFKTFYDGKAKIQFKDCVRWLDQHTTFFVFKK